ncbi:MAG: competence/damage-inducible protein A [Planctomycetes bacterium GWF2_41_51]|nr:MAG: competence/damage-inducible protein A [Planctomycetes bacterium GWF2_41_51]HBG25714.1 competence/damage-inducible protein A [Phycisphaerales bacterium]
MKKAAIISVGNELLNGNTVDTNSNWLESRLLTISIPVVYSCAIIDDIEEIKNAIEYASRKANIILITGGLGPTDDDITRDGIAKFLNVELEYHPEIFKKMENFFLSINRPLVEKNRIQAYLPVGASEIENDLGTAPGIFYQDDQKIIASFPGVPSEMKQMFDKSIFPKLQSLSADNLVIKKIKCIGAGESMIAEMIGDMMDRGRNPLINCTVDHGIITLHIIARAKDRKIAEDMAVKDTEKLQHILGPLIFGYDNQTIAEVAGQKLAEKKKTLATAESCTGGQISKMITDVPGSSRYFTYGWITYSNEAKISQLGVDKKLIEQFGAVSSEVATAMAIGARKKAGSDYAIAVTGIAGPEGGTEQKPVGLVYISIVGPNSVKTEKFLFGSRNRDFIRLRTCQVALNLLRLNLSI